MKQKKKLLYIPFAIVFIFSIAVLVIHFSNIRQFINFAPHPYQFPFSYSRGIINLGEPGRNAGLEVGDRIVSIDGEPVKAGFDLKTATKRLSSSKPLVLEIERGARNAQAERKTITIKPFKFEKNSDFYLGILVNLAFQYLLPTFCILLGLWVLIVRVEDYLAWLLFFLLCGLATISLEQYESRSLIGFFRLFFFNSWSLSMFLFGLYFPERWSVDKRLPWLKWIFIVPLSLQIIMMIVMRIGTLAGMDIEFIRSIDSNSVVGIVLSVLNLLAIGIFFAALTHKSTSLQNSDSRRRLKLMAAGTITSMLPTFLIVLYRILANAKGSFFDIVPGWLAITALLVLLLFPITMAYVIVVQRAMNVSVVIRLGLRYALARNGVLIVQVLLTVGVVLTALSFASDTETNRVKKIVFIALGIAGVFLIRLLSGRIRTWIDRRFFRDAYDAEQILTELSEEVRTIVETRPLLENVSNKISESLHVPQITMLLRNEHRFQPAFALGYDGAPSAGFSEDNKLIERLKANESLVIYQDEKDSWINDEMEESERGELQKLNTQLLLPIGVKNQLDGLISLSPKLSEEPFTANDLRLLKLVASQTGLALENSRLTETIAREAAQKERINRELEIAREVQERLFPQELPEIEGLDYYGACRSALDVGGDYYDFLEFQNGKFGIAIGDISGKGIGASLMMASLQASLRGQTLHFGDDLAGLLSQMNSLLYDASTSNRYATFFYSQYDANTRKLSYVNAGHNPPFLLRPKDDDFEVLTLAEGGAVVGMLPPMLVSYERGEITLQPGDLIVGSTDGITEAMNPAEEEWGEDAMVEELKKVHGKSAKEILEYIVSKADEFANGAKQHDDMTLIVVNVL